jgi:beta-mannosidase
MQKILIISFIFMNYMNIFAQNITLLNEDWRVKPAFPKPEKGLPDEWFATKVPALAHSILMEKNVVPDLFYRDNETHYQWLEEEDFIFEKIFDIDEKNFAQQNLNLVFEGLDTHADVFFNGQLIIKADNAFRTWKADIKNLARPKGNYIRIYFYSAVKTDAFRQMELGYSLPGGPTNERVFSRKGQFNYGWDWGPRFPSCGIWRNVTLQSWNDVTLDNLNVRQLSLTDNEALLEADIEFKNTTIGKKEITLYVDNQIFTQKINCTTTGLQIATIKNISIKKPKRWWSLGLGEQYRYEVKCTLKSDEEEVEKSIKIGLRTLELVREKDKIGESFYFKLNGVPVFAKGANYIPMSIFQDQVTEKNYQQLVQDMVDANMNMVRIWGGGIYENDIFYDLCDEKGVMVWQDFMYACAMYPGDKNFLDNAKEEAIENIKRLRHHPSIALWCGNNEINEAWHNWGWQVPLLVYPKRKDFIWNSYKTLFMSILPEVTKQYGNGTAYWETSPSHGRYHVDCDKEGDSHYWGVWHDEEPFEQYQVRVPRFMSEYGFQSFPEWKTVLSFTEPQDRDLETPVMLVHQKHPRGNTLIKKYMGREYHVPQKFEDFVYVSQVVQAEGILRGIEAHRRAMPYCMGTLYWQLNDVWAVASWSGIDGLGRWKALHYAAKKGFEPLLISPLKEGKNIEIHIVSDFLQAKKANLHLQVFDFQGNKIGEEIKKHIEIVPNGSKMYEDFSVSRLLHHHKANDVFAVVTVENEEGVLGKRIFYFDYPKNLHLPKATIQHEIVATTEGYKVILRSDKLAKNVFIQTDAKGRWSDNYFDLLPNETKEINFKLENGDFLKDFLIKSLTDTY